MKIEELSHEEIVALTEADLDRFVKLAMAEEGIPILDEPVEPDFPAIPIEDMKMYSAECLGEICFSDVETCDKVISILRDSPATYRKRSMYPLKCSVAYPKFTNEYKQGEGSFELVGFNCHSVSQYNRIKQLLEKRNNDEKEYKKELEAYNKSVKDSTYIRNEIHAVYYQHKAIDQRKEYLKKKFDQYLSLAEGVPNIAMNFLTKVEALSDEEGIMLTEYFHAENKDA